MINERIQYIIVGKEICPETKKEHYQGYLELTNPLSLGSMKKVFNDNTHFEARRGTQEQAIKYCKKEGDFEEFGECKKQGRRTDLEIVREHLKNGMKDFEILEEVSSFQAVNGIQKLRLMMIKPRPKDVKPKVEWYYGESGCGKTRTAKEVFDDDYDDCDFQNGFLIGYTGKKNVLFDDYRGQVPLHTLLKMLDWGQCTVNVKNGSCFFAAEHIIFTSPKSARKTYGKVNDENLDQLLRRIDITRGTEEWTRGEGNTIPHL